VSCLCGLTMALVTAQSQSESNVDYQIATQSTSEASFVDIHGSGVLDLSQLLIDPITMNSDDGSDDVLSLQAAILTLNGFKENSNDDLFISAGLGAKGNDGKYYACCSESAAEAGCCNKEELGQLIVPDDAVVRSVNITYSDGSNSANSTFGQGGVVRFWKTSYAAVVFGNCQSSADDGTTLRVHDYHFPSGSLSCH